MDRNKWQALLDECIKIKKELENRGPNYGTGDLYRIVQTGNLVMAALLEQLMVEGGLLGSATPAVPVAAPVEQQPPATVTYSQWILCGLNWPKVEALLGTKKKQDLWYQLLAAPTTNHVHVLLHSHGLMDYDVGYYTWDQPDIFVAPVWKVPKTV